MKKVRLLICLLIVFCITPLINVSAEGCSAEQLKTLKEQAEAIRIDAEFDYNDIMALQYDNYNISVYGLTEDFFVRTPDMSVGIFYENVVNGVANWKVTSDNDIFNVYSSKCFGEVLKEIKLDLKVYNVYSLTEECEGINSQDLEVCSEFLEEQISYNEFITQIERYNNYILDLDANNTIMDLFKEYYYVVIIFGILLVVFITFLIVKRRKRNVLD